MCFSKFISLLDKKALYFCRSDKLEDKLEGTHSKKSINNENEILEIISRDIDAGSPSLPKEIINSIKQHDKTATFIRRNIRKFSFINCWCISEHESAAMWKLYLKNEEGVAIKSTVNQLREVLKAYQKLPAYIGQVQYVDFKSFSFSMPLEPQIFPFFFKRKSFEHEKELRVLISVVPKKGNNLDLSLLKETPKEPGLCFPTNLDTLINKVVVPETSKEWFKELVQSVLSKYGVNKEVEGSTLSIEPAF